MWTWYLDLSQNFTILLFIRRIIDKLTRPDFVRVENLECWGKKKKKKLPDSFGKVSTHPQRICATFCPFVVSSKVAPLIPRKLFVTREPSTCVLSFSSRKFPLRRRELKNLPRKISQRLNNSSLSLFFPSSKIFHKILSSSISRWKEACNGILLVVFFLQKKKKKNS